MKNALLKSLLLALFMTAVSFSCHNPAGMKDRSDAVYYVNMAEGHSGKALFPYSKRVLYPWIVGRFSALLGVERSFLFTGTLAYSIFIFITMFIMGYYLKVPFVIGAGLFVMPWLFNLYGLLYVPTVFFLSLSSLYFLLLYSEKYIASLAVLALLLFTRDESILIAFGFILIMTWRAVKYKDKRLFSYAAIAVTAFLVIASACVLGYKTGHNRNLHYLPNVLYLIFKIPFYGLRNFFGIKLWVSSYQNLPGYVHAPLLAFNAPHWLESLSRIGSLGIYEFDPSVSRDFFLVLLSTFGTTPTIIFYILKKRYIIRNMPLSFYAAFIYGILALFIMPFVSASLFSIYATSWPLCLFVAPVLLNRLFKEDKKTFFTALALFIISGWLPVSAYYINVPPGALLVAEIALHVYTWLILSKHIQPAGARLYAYTI
ncbi:MAG: hypothetical protein JW994_05300 [Candidatus Omnitrophica bacterium]|nr:hypothetical protein [Candidatus Omnitrophota bacterium]